MPDLSPREDWFRPRVQQPGRPGHSPAEPVAAPAEAPALPAIWSERMCWVQRIDGAPAIELGQVMRAHGYSVAVLYAHDGTDFTAGTDALLRWTVAMQAQGLGVFGAGWLPERTTSATRSADAAWADCLTFAWSGWVANGEKETERRVGYSGEFVRAFRKLAGPDFPLGWSPEPQLDLDHAVFREHQVCYMQQSYGAENQYDMTACLTVAKRQGYAMSQCKPLVGFHEAAVRGMADPVARAVSESRVAREAGALAPVMYPAEQTLFRPELWEALASS